MDKVLEIHFPDENYGVSELAREMKVSRSGLHLQMRKVKNISVSRYIREFRLNKGLEMLKEFDAI